MKNVIGFPRLGYRDDADEYRITKEISNGVRPALYRLYEKLIASLLTFMVIIVSFYTKMFYLGPR
jgi:predicted membrane-bound mannosyltransferase